MGGRGFPLDTLSLRHIRYAHEISSRRLDLPLEPEEMSSFAPGFCVPSPLKETESIMEKISALATKRWGFESSLGHSIAE